MSRSGTSRTILFAIFALALAVRALVPAGWMPGNVDGHIVISLCTGEGEMPGWIDSNGKVHKGEPKKEGQGDGSCAFAGLAPGLAAPHDFLPAMVADPADAVASRHAFLTIGQGLAAPPPPATGPPAFA